MHVGIEVVTEGSLLEMGSAEGESLRKKIRSSPDGLAQLYAFRMLQPPWMPYSLYRWVSESRANDSSKPREMRFSRGASSDEGDRTEKPGMRGPKPLVAH